MRIATPFLRSLALLSFTTFLGLPSGLAQAPAAGSPAQTTAVKTAATNTFVIEAGDLRLTDLIDRAATFLQWNILCNPMEMASQSQVVVKLQRRMEVDRQGCHELLATLLTTNGFALTGLDEGKQMYEVVAMNGPRNREIMNHAAHRSPEEILAHPDLRMAVTTVVQLEHINATIATNALRPFFANTGAPSGGGSLTLGNVGNNAGMLLSGMQDQVANAIRLLRLVDVPSPKEPEQGLTEQVESLQQRVAKLEKALEKQDKPADKSTEKR